MGTTCKEIFDIETIKRWWLPDPVVALIAKFDGLNLLLFHVEQSTDWEYRIEWGNGGEPQVKKARSACVRLPIQNFNLPIHGEWRDGPDAAWQPMRAHVFTPTRAKFAVQVLEPRDFSDPKSKPILHVMTMVRGEGAYFMLTMPRRVLAADGPEEIVVDGVSGASGPGSILLNPGDFSRSEGAYRVTNLEILSRGLKEVGCAVRGVESLAQEHFMVSQGRMDPEEIEQFQAFLKRHG